MCDLYDPEGWVMHNGMYHYWRTSEGEITTPMIESALLAPLHVIESFGIMYWRSFRGFDLSEKIVYQMHKELDNKAFQAFDNPLHMTLGALNDHGVTFLTFAKVFRELRAKVQQ